MNSNRTTSGPADATGIENPHSTAPVDGATATASPTGPAPGRQSTKAPIWMKPRPVKPPPEKQKPPRLGEKMKHLSSLFESQTNELQWTMHDNAKCMLNLCEKIHRKTKSLYRSKNKHYYNEHDLDSERKPKQKPFVHSSCWLKSPLTRNGIIRKRQICGRCIRCHHELPTKRELLTRRVERKVNFGGEK